MKTQHIFKFLQNTLFLCSLGDVCFNNINLYNLSAFASESVTPSPQKIVEIVEILENFASTLGLKEIKLSPQSIKFIQQKLLNLDISQLKIITNLIKNPPESATPINYKLDELIMDEAKTQLLQDLEDLEKIYDQCYNIIILGNITHDTIQKWKKLVIPENLLNSIQSANLFLNISTEATEALCENLYKTELTKENLLSIGKQQIRAKINTNLFQYQRHYSNISNQLSKPLMSLNMAIQHFNMILQPILENLPD